MSTPTPTFDPFQQTIILKATGQPSFPVAIPDIDAYTGYALRIVVNYSSQVGASLILLVVLLLVTRSEKRNSPVFILNSLSLALNAIRNILQILYFTGPFYEFYAYFALDYSRVPLNEFRISIAGDVLTLLLVACIEVSLILQVRAVCVTLRDRYKQPLLLLSILIALAAIGVRFALTVQNARAIMSLNNFDSGYTLALSALAVVTSSIFVFSAIFVTKLGVALYERRKLGLRQWGPMQILLIMGGQTLIIPAIFSALQFATSVPELGSQVLTVTAIFLPLSSMWASATVESRARISTPNRSLVRRILGSFGLHSKDGTNNSSKRLGSVSNADSKSIGKVSQSSNAPAPYTYHMERDPERDGLSIHMGRSASVTGDYAA